MKVDGCDFKRTRPEAKPLLLQTLLDLQEALDRELGPPPPRVTIEDWCRFDGGRFWRRFDLHGRE